MRMLGLLAWTLLAGTATQDKPVALKFSYAQGDQENIRMELRITTSTEVISPKVTTTRKNSGPISLVLRKECRKVEGGSFVFDAEVADLELQQVLEAETGKIEIFLKGDNVVMKAGDGKKLIDTKAGIHPDKAKPILKQFAGLKGKFELTLDTCGLMKGLEKNPKLRELLGPGDNLYPIILPKEPVSVGGQWTHTHKMKQFGAIVLKGDPLELPLQCRLERMDGGIAVLATTIKAEFKDVEGTGKLEGISGEKKVRFSSVNLSGKGETRFDPARGRILKSEMEMTIRSEMILEAEELGGAGLINLEMTARAEMKPEAAAPEKK